MVRTAMVARRGRDAVQRFDFGFGRMGLPDDPEKPDEPVVAVASCAHVDPVGGFHAFADRRGHAAEAAGLPRLPGPGRLR
jgi:hypothetical protein